MVLKTKEELSSEVKADSYPKKVKQNESDQDLLKEYNREGRMTFDLQKAHHFNGRPSQLTYINNQNAFDGSVPSS